MSGRKQAQPPLRGEAAFRAAKDAVAKRNEAASKVAREKRQKRDDEHAAAVRAADQRERAELAKR